jgi:glycine oxidase
MRIHDTSSKLRNSADIVIIGGGVIGLTIARAPRCAAFVIFVLSNATTRTESSFAAAGMPAPQAEADSRDDFFDLRQSRDIYELPQNH